MENPKQSTRDEAKARRRSLQHLQAIRVESIREEARQAVEQAVKLALQTLECSKEEFPRRHSFSEASHSSYLSHQRAIHRGSGRGFFEPVDDIDSGFILDDVFSTDRQLTTQPTAGTESRMTDDTGRWSMLKKLKRRASKPTLKLASELSKEAWMCGVCAKSFSSFAAAVKHENYHIQEVVTDMGWGANKHSHSQHEELDVVTLTTDPRDPATPVRPTTPLDTSSRRDVSMRTPSSPHPRPDVLHMSNGTLCFSARGSMQPYNTPALQRKKRLSRRDSLEDLDDTSRQSINGHVGSEYDLTTSIVKPSYKIPMSPIDEKLEHEKSRKNCQKPSIDVPNNGNNESSNWLSHEHDLLVPHGMRNCVVLADEALADVCEKAKPLILSHQEQEAELELHYLAQDKAYYDMLHVRSVDRRRGGTYTHFRAEGKSILSKVQNKLVDAYQLMKEGKAKGKITSMDHYTRKLKGDVDTINILENTQKTLFVNVIVKASLKVVTYELQRLAKLRWEAAQAKKIDNDPQAERFQQFRALAQDNLVKLAGMALAADFTPRRIAVQLSNDFYRYANTLKPNCVLLPCDISPLALYRSVF